MSTDASASVARARLQARTGQIGRPAHRSKSRRNDRAQDAKRHLGQYQAHLALGAGPASQPSLGRTMRLLHAMAALEQTLHAETGGRYGDPYATPQSILRQSSKD